MRLVNADALNRKDVNCANVPMNFIDTAPTVEAIPKAEYETRLKADMVAMLDKIRTEIEEQYDRVHPYNISCAEGLEMALGIINKYKTESEKSE